MKLTQYLIENCSSEWSELLDHPFGQKLCNGELSQKHFVNYLQQDYLYLIDYLKAFGLLLTKTRNKDERNFVIKCIVDMSQPEMEMQELLKLECPANKKMVKTLTCSAYTSWFYEVAANGDWLDLLVALAPCTIGYYFFGQTLKPQLKTSKLLKTWISFYQGNVMTKSYLLFKDMIDRQMISDLTPDRLQELVDIFKKGVWLENRFFSNTINNQ